jgi:acetyltransferase
MESGTAPVTLQPATRARLRELLGPAAAVGNPVDLAGAADGDPERFARAIEVLVTDPDVGVVLVVGLFGGYALRFDESLAGSEVRAAGAMAAGARAAGVGLVVHTMYAPEPTPSLAVLRDEGVPVVESLEVACRCASALVERGQALARAPWRPSGAGERTRATGTAVRALSEPEARARLGAAGVPLVPAWACADEEAAVEAAAACAGPVVLKVLADGVVHKSDAGGVRLDVRGEAAVREAFADVTRAARTYRSQAGAGQREREEGVRGVLVSPHLPPPVAEILAGVHLDPQVGAVLTLGAGGIWVESLADVALRALPVGSADIRAMLAELRLAPVLGGARGRPGADLGALVEAVAALARLIERDPEVTEAEVNPLFAYPDRCVAVDARVYVACPSDADAVPCPSHA